MGTHIVVVSDEVENADVKLSMFARTLESGEAMVVPIPRGFPMHAMPEVAARVHFMLTQYVAVYAEKDSEAEPETEPAQT
jgi:hypothetical protein